MSVFRRKSIQDLLGGEEGEVRLSRTLSAFDLAMLGVGAVIGTGIFVVTGVAAAEHAGPGLVLSFVLAAIVCVFAALCYAEFASTVPAAGSAYTYSYAAFGELLAWVLGWDLILEYGIAASAVAIGWSGYFQSLLSGFGLHIPHSLTSAYDPVNGTYFDLPAAVIIMLITILLTKGAKKTARFNTVMVFIKLGVVLLFIAVGVWYVKPGNWSPFLPYGFHGVAAGASAIFFAYIGFDSVSTAAEEVRNPQRDMPIGLIASLGICTLLYVAVSLVLTGIVPYTKLNVKNPVAFALEYIGQDWAAGLLSLGAIAGITTVLLVLLYGQSRLFYAMSRDGLLPAIMSRVNAKSRTPVINTWMIGVVVTFVAGFMPFGRLANLTSIGTLFAFTVVSVGVWVMRYTHPDVKRGFRVPCAPVISSISALSCIYLMSQLGVFTWKAFILWVSAGLVIYFAYGYWHSHLNTSHGKNRQR